MKMKKLKAMILVAALAAGLTTGCGSSLGTASDTTDAEAATAAVEETSQAEAKETESTAKSFEGVTLTMLKDSDATDAGLNKVLELAEQKLGIKVEEQCLYGSISIYDSNCIFWYIHDFYNNHLQLSDKTHPKAAQGDGRYQN